MLVSRIAAISAATILTGAAIAALSTVNPFQMESQKVEQHEMITKGAGNWAGEISMINPQTGEAMTSECTESITAIGDYWTVSEFKSSFMGMPFHGSSTMGYDIEKKVFTANWVDSMTTSMIHMEGNYNKERGGIVMDYKSKDPMTGEMKSSRMLIVQNEDMFSSTFFDVTDGQETKTMSIEMKRQPKAMEASAEKAGDAVEEAADAAKDAVKDAADQLKK